MITSGLIQQFRILLPSSWRWPATMDCEMPNSPDTLRILLTWFIFRTLKHGHGIHGFRSILTLPDRQDFCKRLKLLEPSGYCTVLNCTFTFHTENVFGFFRDILVQVILIRCKFLNETMLQAHMCGFQITHRRKQCTVRYLPLFWSRNIHTVH